MFPLAPGEPSTTEPIEILTATAVIYIVLIFAVSAAGKALLLLSKGEARRLLANMPSAYRAAVNFGERTVVWEGPARGRVLMRRDFMPCAWHEGVVLAALEGMNARAVQLRGSRLEVLDSEYLVCWE